VLKKANKVTAKAKGKNELPEILEKTDSMIRKEIEK